MYICEYLSPDLAGILWCREVRECSSWMGEIEKPSCSQDYVGTAECLMPSLVSRFSERSPGWLVAIFGLFFSILRQLERLRITITITMPLRCISPSSGCIVETFVFQAASSWPSIKQLNTVLTCMMGMTMNSRELPMKPLVCILPMLSFSYYW